MGVHERVESFIKRFELIPERGVVVVAFSGGADSRCLLDILHRTGARIAVAHLDHSWSEASRKQAEFARSVAEGYGLPFELGTWEPPGGKAGLEEASRWARYRFLVRVAKKLEARHIATGHTMTDQAETLLLHLARGAGLEGLTGMEPRTDLGDWVELNKPQGLYLVRPLLRISRRETQAYCLSAGLEWIRDPANLDIDFVRNLIREEVLPVLRRVNPDVEGAFYRAARALAPVRNLLDQLGARAWDRVVERHSEGEIVIRRARFTAEPEAVQVWLLRKAVQSLLGRGEPSYGATRELVQAIKRASYRPAELPGGLQFQEAGGLVSLSRAGSRSWIGQFPQLVTPAPIVLPVPGVITMRDGWVLKTAIGDGVPGSTAGPHPAQDRWTAAVDRESVGALKVRGFAPGDRIQPLGMEGSQKVADLFTNEKVPRAMRPNWPIVVSGSGAIVWVAGLRLSHPFRVVDESADVISLKLRRTGRGGAGENSVEGSGLQGK